MNKLQKFLYSSIASGGAFYSSVYATDASMGFGGGNVTGEVKGTDASADVAIQTLINRATAFLAILAVVYALWGGFQIMTAGGDDKKVGNGKNIIMHAAMGLVVIFLAWSIVSFVLNILYPANSTTGA